MLPRDYIKRTLQLPKTHNLLVITVLNSKTSEGIIHRPCPSKYYSTVVFWWGLLFCLQYSVKQEICRIVVTNAYSGQSMHWSRLGPLEKSRQGGHVLALGAWYHRNSHISALWQLSGHAWQRSADVILPEVWGYQRCCTINPLQFLSLAAV